MRDIMKQEMDDLNKKMEDKNNMMKKEYREQEDRKNNIVIHGAPESKEKEGDKRQEEDSKFLERFIQTGLEVNLYGHMIRKVSRIGKWEASAEEPRPMLATFDTSYFKRDIPVNAKNLKSKDECEDIYVQHDMTITRKIEKTRTSYIKI